MGEGRTQRQRSEYGQSSLYTCTKKRTIKPTELVPRSVGVGDEKER
jgi:hypothetical protein